MTTSKLVPLTAATWQRCPHDGSYMIPTEHLLGYAPDGNHITVIFEYYRYEENGKTVMRTSVHALGADAAQQIPDWDDEAISEWLQEAVSSGLIVDLKPYLFEATELYWVVDCRPGRCCSYLVSYDSVEMEGPWLRPGYAYANFNRYPHPGDPVGTPAPRRVQRDTIMRVIADGTASFAHDEATLVSVDSHIANKTMGVTDLGGFHRAALTSCTSGDQVG